MGLGVGVGVEMIAVAEGVEVYDLVGELVEGLGVGKGGRGVGICEGPEGVNEDLSATIDIQNKY